MPTTGCAKFTMRRSRLQTPGWAAFDRKHREKQGNGAEGALNPFQTISNETYLGLMQSSNDSHSSENSVQFQSLPARSFSSVVRASMPVEFPLLKAHSKLGAANMTIDGDQHVVTVKSNDNPAGMLKDIHSWADQHLIEDILAAVDNDVEQASILLNEMISSEAETKNKQTGPFGMCSSARGSANEDTDIFLEKGNTFLDNNLADNSHKELIVKQFYVPTEPDWEEDDVYLSHRQEALKMMRAASQHSRGASNAYLRGDHLTARQLSSRAREEWIMAEQLNAEAADEILRIRNSSNDIWTLDLHGLHATEAVHALKQHLQRIESKMMNRSSSPAKLERIQPIPSSNAKGNVVCQRRQTLIHVITGTGNHSKGEASLPAAIKNFLCDGGYRFDDAKPGVISVHPMFRSRKT